MTAPKVSLLAKHDRRVRGGSPWIFANEIDMTPELKALPRGTLVRLALSSGRLYGQAQFNPHSLIVGRLLTRNLETPIDAGFFARRISRAKALRERLIGGVAYRLIHAEGDQLPGVIVDRFDDVLVVQLNTAGAELARDALVDALREVLAPRVIILRRDGRARALEGLDQQPPEILGDLTGPVAVQEGVYRFLADPLEGQKTGWYFDQRFNRALLADLSRDLRVLDLYSYAGGFALAAAQAGAASVLAVDRSQPALDLAERAAVDTGVKDRLTTKVGDVFEVLGQLETEKRRFDVVIADPPPFAPAKKDVPTALKGYRKLTRAAAAAVAQDGFLAIASCSHHIDEAAFFDTVRHGLKDAGRSARLLGRYGAGPDHPQHPALPETRYLKLFLWALD